MCSINTIPPASYGGSSFSIASATFVIVCLLYSSHPTHATFLCTVGFICVSLITSSLFLCLPPSVYLLNRNRYSSLLPFLKLFCLLLLSFKNSLHILDINPIPEISSQRFSPFCGLSSLC